MASAEQTITMKAIYSIILGITAIATILWHQSATYQEALGGNLMHSLDWKIRMMTVAIALLGIAQSIGYTKTRLRQYYYLNRIGRLLSVLAILLAIIPIYRVFIN